MQFKSKVSIKNNHVYKGNKHYWHRNLKSKGLNIQTTLLMIGVTPEDVVFVILSGGGSALMPLPCQGVTLEVGIFYSNFIFIICLI